MAELIFNGANQEAMDDFSVIPAGVYNAQITKSDVVPTKNKQGTRLNLQFKIIDGDFKGRIVFGGYNIANPSEQAVEISRKELKSLSDSVGLPDGFTDTNQLHGKPLRIKLKITPADGQYAEKNEITYYEPYEDAGGLASSTPDAESSSGGKPDWAQ